MAQRVALATLLAALSLAVHLTLAWQFHRVGAFEQVNVLFRADISTRLEAISGGKHLGIKHPNLMPYFTPPIALVARIVVRLSPEWGPEPELQKILGMLLVPLASALKTVIIFSLFLRLGFSAVAATVLSSLEMMSFSTLIFGSIPESYGLTALAVAMAYALAVAAGPSLTLGRGLLWLAIGVFATGITVTNIILVALLLGATAWCSATDRLVASVRATILVIAMFGVTAVSAYGLDWLLVPPAASGTRHLTAEATVLDRAAQPFQKEFVRHLQSDRARKLRRFPTSMANALAPPTVERVPVVRAVGRHRLGFTLEGTPNIFALGDLFGLSLFVLVIVGGVHAVALPATRAVAIASIGILGFSWLLSVWGTETCLHSQNWQLGAVVLLAGVMRASRRGAAMTAAIGLLTVVIAVNNLLILRGMLAILAAVP